MEQQPTFYYFLGSFEADPRKRYNQKHRFLDIITITIFAVFFHFANLKTF